jgi:hypothetical protein
MQRVTFSQVFQENHGGSLSPIRTINVNGISFGPSSRGISFGGVDFIKYKGKDLSIEDHGTYWEIKGIYLNVEQ